MKKPLAAFLMVLIFLGCVAGLFLTAILMSHHQGRSEFQDIVEKTCGISSSSSCDVVNRSDFSRFLGMPVAFWGWQYYMAVLLLILGFFWEKNIFYLRLALLLGLFAILFDLVLFSYSFFILKTLCPLCVLSYGATFLCTIPLFFYIRHYSKQSEVYMKKIKVRWLLGGIFFTSLSLSFLYCREEPSQRQENKKDFNAVLEEAFQDFLKAYEKEPRVDLGNPVAGFRGASEAKFVIHEFADPLCPYCSLMGKKLKDFVSKNPNKVKVIYRHFPLDKNCNSKMKQQLHAGACELSFAMQCAHQQNRFFDMHDAIFAEQATWAKQANLADLSQLAKSLGMNVAKFQTCFQGNFARQAVARDLNKASELNVSGTPTLFVNNRKLPAVHADFIEFFLQKLLEHEEKK